MRHIETEREPLESSEPGPGARGAISEEERLQKALDLAYAYVNPRDRTVGEVRQRLQRRGVSEEPTETAIQMLGQQGFLDDARFARLFVADKRALEEWGSERIRRTLLSRGIDRHLADAALAEAAAPQGDHGEPESELDRALALLRRRFPDPPQDRGDRNRALGMLMRKGYESELALDALAAHSRGD
ncbi:MAG TPA: RecX family transcriptional regulator [Solirubrobacteraceae bacterium]|nr:RecX family transcriptional regulator [Solirubrobacteraceae bacterium]